MPTRVVDIPDLVKREYRISTNMGYINMTNARWSKCITTAKTTWWICVLSVKYIALFGFRTTQECKCINAFLPKEILMGDKYIMPFLFKNYSVDSIYAPRGLAYTPLPFRPFSRPFKQKGGADR